MSSRSYILASMDEPIAMSKILNLWLQAFDNQPGVSLSFHQLDYPRLSLWLDTILELHGCLTLSAPRLINLTLIGNLPKLVWQ